MSHNHPAVDHICTLYGCASLSEAERREVEDVAQAIARADTLFVTTRLDVDPNKVRYERLAAAAIQRLRAKG